MSMNGRYRIVPAPRDGYWAIWDERLQALCTLPDDAEAEHPNLLPLEWRSRAGAEAWLLNCRMNWLTGRAPEPEGAGARIIETIVRDGWGTKRVKRWL